MQSVADSEKPPQRLDIYFSEVISMKPSPRWQHWLKKRANRVFLLCFLLLNLLLFLPFYLLNRADATLFPVAELFGRDWRTDLQALLIWRKNIDPFRWNIELIMLVGLWVNISHLRRRSLRPFFILCYFLTFLYYAYEAITLSIYQVDPIFYHHYYLVLDGLQFLLSHLHLSLTSYLGALLLVALALITVYALVRSLYSISLTAHLSPWLRISLGVLALIMLLPIFAYRQVLASPVMVVSSLYYKVAKNVEKSLQVYHDVANFDDTAIHQTYDYRGMELHHKPNIYLIFVESYGSVLYQRPDYKVGYELLLQKLQKQLTDGGWYTASTLSESPTWGGGSWLAYSSAFFGLRMETHPQFLALLNKYQAQSYPNLGRYLKTQGYNYYHLSSLSSELSEGDWLKQERFFGVDHWFRFEELQFTGPMYGWGPAPPDQYALHYAHDRLTAESNKPFALFFITQNSHYPFAPIPTLAADWRTLKNDEPSPPGIDPEGIPHDQRRRNYAEAIRYELSMLTEFVLTAGDENDLFIFIGDHQPPRVSRRDDGFATPVHMVSRDQRLIASLQEYGFTPGLQVTDLTPTMKHEGLYSLLVRTLLYNYGDGDHTTLPVYLPAGFVATPTAAGN
ncbi:MAG: hypothetical protein DYG89_31590 [Caldilinea sp. CFX5]|nr:hypothetical protein [Caldilinea sp. CFX5]